MIAKAKKFIREDTVMVLLGLFLVLSFLSLPFVAREEKALTEVSNIETIFPGETLRLSDIREARIDDKAATVVANERASLPVKVWMFLLVAYVGLLIFNLAYGFREATHLQWGWEACLTLLFLGGWFYWDETGAMKWFPLSLLQMGVLIYALYLYFFNQKKIHEHSS